MVSAGGEAACSRMPLCMPVNVEVCFIEDAKLRSHSHPFAEPIADDLRIDQVDTGASEAIVVAECSSADLGNRIIGPVDEFDFLLPDVPGYQWGNNDANAAGCVGASECCTGLAASHLEGEDAAVAFADKGSGLILVRS